MSNKKRIHVRRRRSEQAELLNRPVSDLKDQQVVKDLLSDEFVQASDAKASEVTVALAELIRGQKMMTEELTRVRQRMNAYDEAAAKFDADREKFIQEVMDNAEKLRVTGEKLDKVIAEGVRDYQDKVQEAKAEGVHERLKFEEALRDMPRETITAPGIIETVMRNGVPTPVITPEVIRIKHKAWVLQPNTPTEVPEIVAIRYRQILRGRQENSELKGVLGANMKDTEISRALQRINEKYGSGTDSFPVGSTA